MGDTDLVWFECVCMCVCMPARVCMSTRVWEARVHECACMFVHEHLHVSVCCVCACEHVLCVYTHENV